MAQDRKRRLAAVWFADIVGYTELSSRDEDGALAVVDELQRLAREEVESLGGRIVKFVGDAVLTVFDSTDAGLKAALALQESFSDSDIVREMECALRIGMHVGEVVEADDGDVYGDGVNMASRIEGVAEAGQVVVSEAVEQQVRQRTTFLTKSIGSVRLQGVAARQRVYTVSAANPSADRPVPFGFQLRRTGLRLTVAIVVLLFSGLLLRDSLQRRGEHREEVVEPPVASAAEVRDDTVEVEDGSSGEPASTALAAEATIAGAARESAMPDWYLIDNDAETIELHITAQMDGGWKFNGMSGGDETITVPVGYAVTVEFKNDDPNMAHSVGIDAQVGGYPVVFSDPQPAFSGAISSNPTSMMESTLPGEGESFTFTADVAGEYAMVCYVPGHAVSGMWVRFNVTGDDARAPSEPTLPRLFRECSTCPELVVVPAGTFVMGSPLGELGRETTEGPQHEVSVGSFALGIRWASWAGRRRKALSMRFRWGRSPWGSMR